MHEAKLAPALPHQVAEWPTAGLHLRMLSHTATWPYFFTKELRKHFGREQNVAVLQLAPLTSAQVRQAAEAHTIDADAFEAAVLWAEAVALASRPVTLRMLLKLWLHEEFNADTGRGRELGISPIEALGSAPKGFLKVKFQFHLVRLKPRLVSRLLDYATYFNSTWSD